MAYFHTNVLDPQIKALPTVGTAQGSVASFDTDMTEDLIEVVCEIQYSQASGTPTPTNPIPITVYSSLNLSHSGADTSNPTITNIPFGQTVAKGTLNVTTGVLMLTYGYDSFDLSQIAYTNSNGIDSWALTASQSSTGGSDNIGKKCNINGVYSFSTTRYEHFYIAGTGIRSWFTENTARDKIAQFVYPLETPIEIQLSATQITALLNENNIWCDTNGDTKVKYILSVGKLIS